MDPLLAASNDLKTAIDDIVYEIRKNHEEIREIKEILKKANLDKGD